MLEDFVHKSLSHHLEGFIDSRDVHLYIPNGSTESNLLLERVQGDITCSIVIIDTDSEEEEDRIKLFPVYKTVNGEVVILRLGVWLWKACLEIERIKNNLGPNNFMLLDDFALIYPQKETDTP